jgi:hypothetical protein
MTGSTRFTVPQLTQLTHRKPSRPAITGCPGDKRLVKIIALANKPGQDYQEGTSLADF